MTEKRHPKGVPVGGQFAASAKSEPDVALDGTAETTSLYNVLMPTVHLIEADSPQAAIAKVRMMFAAAGVEPYDDGVDAFESEDQPRSEATVYNVLMPTVHLVKAASPKDSIAKVRAAFAATGIEPYDDGIDAFESEDQDQETTDLPATSRDQSPRPDSNWPSFPARDAATPTPDQTYCDFDMHQQCSGYTEDEADPETCMCNCHDHLGAIR